MTDLIFVDTNVFVYYVDTTEQTKQSRAKEWLDWIWSNRSGRVSTQVFNELYVTTTRKLKPGLSPAEARTMIRALYHWRPIPIDLQVVEKAWSLQDRFALSWWDSLIVASALLQDCTYVLTEDMQHGQQIDSLQIIDPFQWNPSSLIRSSQP